MNEGFIERHIRSLHPSPGVAYDIGANRGLYTTKLAEKFGTVYAFEPHPTNIDILKEVTAPLLNVFVEARAISDRSGIQNLFTCSNHGGHSLSEAVAKAQTWGHKPDVYLNVEAIRIDDFVRTHGNEVDFIKMDIEGAENFVWEGAINTLEVHKPEILMEVHQTVDTDKLYQFFKNAGYIWYNDLYQEVQVIGRDQHYYLRVR